MKLINSKFNIRFMRLFVSRSLLILFLLFFTGFVGIHHCFSAHSAQVKGSVEVNLTVSLGSSDEENTPLENYSVGLCKVANLVSGQYTLTSDFEDTGLSIDNLFFQSKDKSALEVEQYIRKHGISYIKKKTNLQGKLKFSNLSDGIYLVFASDFENIEYTFNPFFAYIPTADNNEMVYNIVSVPKVLGIDATLRAVKVSKVWEDNEDYSKKRPKKITVILKRNGENYQTATLDKNNKWKYVFERLPADGYYSVEEKKVANYNGKITGSAEDGFVITNTYEPPGFFQSIPLTGDTERFILLFDLLAAVALAYLIYELCRRKKKKQNNNIKNKK